MTMRSPKEGMGKYRLAMALLTAGLLPSTAAFAAAQPNEQQMQRLLESAAQSPDRPDHDFAANSIQHLMEQGTALHLSQEQIDKVKAIRDQYAQTKGKREAAYRQTEWEALQLIHDHRSSLASVEAAVQKADLEHSKLRMAGIKALREAADVLSPEQYSQWRQNHSASQVAQSGRGSGTSDGQQAEGERIAPH